MRTWLHTWYFPHFLHDKVTRIKGLHDYNIHDSLSLSDNCFITVASKYTPLDMMLIIFQWGIIAICELTMIGVKIILSSVIVLQGDLSVIFCFMNTVNLCTLIGHPCLTTRWFYARNETSCTVGAQKVLKGSKIPCQYRVRGRLSSKQEPIWIGTQTVSPITR